LFSFQYCTNLCGNKNNQRDTLHIVGSFGPTPGMGLCRVIINDETVPEEKIVQWDPSFDDGLFKMGYDYRMARIV
jgi:hypothetical protein